MKERDSMSALGCALLVAALLAGGLGGYAVGFLRGYAQGAADETGIERQSIPEQIRALFWSGLGTNRNRHIYTNRTVSEFGAQSAAGGLSTKGVRADAARPPGTPPGERSPATAEESAEQLAGRQGAAGWLAWVAILAALAAVALWIAVELAGWLRERGNRRRRLSIVVAPGLERSRETVSHFDATRDHAQRMTWPAGTVGLIQHGVGASFEQCEAFTLAESSQVAFSVRVELLGNLFDGQAKPGDAVVVIRRSFRPYLDAAGRPMQKRPGEGKGAT